MYVIIFAAIVSWAIYPSLDLGRARLPPPEDPTEIRHLILSSALIPGSEKSLCPQNSCPQFWGRKWLRQFYGHLEKMPSFCRKTRVRKIPRFRGGYFGFGGGGSADFIFMGAGIFLTGNAC